MSSIEPFVVSVPDSELERLATKLSTASFPDELEDSGWDYGAPLADVKRLVAYWKDQFDWRKVESKINELPNYRVLIQAEGFEALNIHFVHQKSKVVDAIPLLFCHGWPGNFLEVVKLLPLLARPGSGKSTPAFHIVAPSIPGFGFSEGTKKRGFGLAQYAETCHKLMRKLGYEQYVTQGGDWGCMITRAMGKLYPESCLASHINMPRGMKPSFSSNPILTIQHFLTPYSEKEKRGLGRTQWFLQEGSGYRTLQATKPQTLGYALVDSPVGLLAWIYEKLHDWTDDYEWTPEEILTWVSIYWFSTAGVAAAQRIYYEAMHPSSNGLHRMTTEKYIPHVKLGLAYFPMEIASLPRTWSRTLGPVVFESEHDKGGHFAATERPDAIADDLQKMFGKGGPAYDIVPRRSGYDLTPKL